MWGLFDESKKRIWIDFFRKIGIEGDYRKLFHHCLIEYRENTAHIRLEPIDWKTVMEEEKRDAIKYMKNHPPIPEMIRAINKALAEKPSRIKLLDTVFSEYNSQPPYSISESENKITESLDKNSVKYNPSNIPLIYTTLKLPSQDNFYGYDTWKEIKNASSFKNPDYGNINFIRALLKLKKKGSIIIHSFEVVYIDNSQITVKVVTRYKKVMGRNGLENRKKLITKSERDEFYYNDKETGKRNLINIGTKTIPHAVLEIIHENEGSDFVSYEMIGRELPEKDIKDFKKATSRVALIKQINNAVINEQQGLQKAKVDDKEFSTINFLPDGDKIIKTVRGKGIRFRNYL